MTNYLPMVITTAFFAGANSKKHDAGIVSGSVFV